MFLCEFYQCCYCFKQKNSSSSSSLNWKEFQLVNFTRHLPWWFAGSAQRMSKKIIYDVHSNAFVFPSEPWILPIITLGVMVVYAALAIFFYNSDGWFHIVYVQMSKCLSWKVLNIWKLEFCVVYVKIDYYCQCSMFLM